MGLGVRVGARVRVGVRVLQDDEDHERARADDEGRYRGDTGEIQGRCRGDTGEMQGRCRGVRARS